VSLLVDSFFLPLQKQAKASKSKQKQAKASKSKQKQAKASRRNVKNRESIQLNKCASTPHAHSNFIQV